MIARGSPRVARGPALEAVAPPTPFPPPFLPFHRASRQVETRGVILPTAGWEDSVALMMTTTNTLKTRTMIISAQSLFVHDNSPQRITGFFFLTIDNADDDEHQQNDDHQCAPSY